MIFPSNINTSYEYSIIEIECLPCISTAPDFYDNFVLICSTYLNKNDKAHGHTTFEIQSIKELSYNNPNVKNAKKFVYQGGSLKINDFVTITQAESDYDTKFIARLSYQYHSDQEREYIQEQDLLLFSISEGPKGQLSNIPYLYLPPDFKKYIEYYQAKHDSEVLHTAYSILEHLAKENDYSESFINQFETLKEKQKNKSLILYDSFLRNQYKKI